jgi:predicted O-methyltransferase YrrM
MSCDNNTGTFLRTLAASKKSGAFLELGTGAGISTCWILDGMDGQSNLTTVELDESLHSIAKKHLGHDDRIEFFTGDGEEFIKTNADKRYDFIFADTWPGKFYLLDETLTMLNAGGFFIIDDLLPVPTWPEGHEEKVQHLIQYLEAREDLQLTKLNWSTGLILTAKI